MTNTEQAIKEALVGGELREAFAALLAVAERGGERLDLRQQVAELQREGPACEIYAHRTAVEAITAGRANDAVAFVREQLALVTRAAMATPASAIQFNLRPRTALEIALSTEALKRFGDAN